MPFVVGSCYITETEISGELVFDTSIKSIIFSPLNLGPRKWI